MQSKQTIIDIEPVSYSGYRVPAKCERERCEQQNEPRWTYVYHWDGQPQGRRYSAVYGGAARRASSPVGALVGMAQVAIGAGLVAIGIPMLLLPGPGLLTIAVGGLLASSGMRKIFG